MEQHKAGNTKRFAGVYALVVASLIMAGCAETSEGPDPQSGSVTAERDDRRSLSQFTKGDGAKPCYDRAKQPHTAVTDLHFHSQPFGGPSLPYQEQMDYFEKTEVLFVLLYGIGQQLPYDSSCTYYLDCIGTPARPGMKNDFENAANYVEHPQSDMHIALGADGSLSGVSGWGYEHSDNGSWRIDGDLYCRQWNAWSGGREACFTLFKEGRVLKVYDSTGTFRGKMSLTGS